MKSRDMVRLFFNKKIVLSGIILLSLFSFSHRAKALSCVTTDFREGVLVVGGLGPSFCSPLYTGGDTIVPPPIPETPNPFMIPNEFPPSPLLQYTEFPAITLTDPCGHPSSSMVNAAIITDKGEVPLGDIGWRGSLWQGNGVNIYHLCSGNQSKGTLLHNAHVSFSPPLKFPNITPAKQIEYEDKIIESIATNNSIKIRTGTYISAPLTVTNCVHLGGNGPIKIVFMRGKTISGLDGSVNGFLSMADNIIENGYKKIDPFKTFKDNFSFYADLKKVNEDGLKKENGTYTSGALPLVSSCGRDSKEYTMLFSDATMINGRSYAYLGTPSIYINLDSDSKDPAILPSVAIHETGHALGRIDDEYTENSREPSGGANCTLLPLFDYRSSLDGKLYGAIDQKGCTCHETNKCQAYYRPSMTSIMDNHRTNSKFNVFDAGLLIAAFNGEYPDKAHAEKYWPGALKLDVIKDGIFEDNPPPKITGATYDPRNHWIILNGSGFDESINGVRLTPDAATFPKPSPYEFSPKIYDITPVESGDGRNITFDVPQYVVPAGYNIKVTTRGSDWSNSLFVDILRPPFVLGAYIYVDGNKRTVSLYIQNNSKTNIEALEISKRLIGTERWEVHKMLPPKSLASSIYDDVNVITKSTYEYRMRAQYNDQTYSEYSNIKEVTIPESTVTPEAKVEALTMSDILISWPKIDADSYEVNFVDPSVKVSGTSSYLLQADSSSYFTGILGNSFAVSNLSPGTKYCFVVTAIKARTYSAPSDMVCATTKDPKRATMYLQARQGPILKGDMKFSIDTDISKIDSVRFFDLTYDRTEIYPGDVRTITIDSRLFPNGPHEVTATINPIIDKRGSNPKNYPTNTFTINIQNEGGANVSSNGDFKSQVAPAPKPKSLYSYALSFVQTITNTIVDAIIPKREAEPIVTPQTTITPNTTIIPGQTNTGTVTPGAQRPAVISNGAPILNQIYPTGGTVGSTVLIYGTFTSGNNTIYVKVDGKTQTIRPSYQDTLVVQFALPVWLKDKGTVNFFVENGDLIMSEKSLPYVVTPTPAVINTNTNTNTVLPLPLVTPIITAPVAPSLLSITPQSGYVGQNVTIYGTFTSGNNTVYTTVDNKLQTIPISFQNTTSIQFTIPNWLASKGVVNFSVENGNLLMTPTTLSFTVIPTPVTPTYTPNLHVDLTANGQDITSVTKGGTVTLNWNSISATSCTTDFDSPQGLSGSVTLTMNEDKIFNISCTDGKTTTTDYARVYISAVSTPPSTTPAITSISPTSAYAGQSVSIYATNLTPTQNTIYIKTQNTTSSILPTFQDTTHVTFTLPVWAKGPTSLAVENANLDLSPYVTFTVIVNEVSPALPSTGGYYTEDFFGFLNEWWGEMVGR